MSKIEWGMFAGLVAVVVVAIAAEPDHKAMAGHEHAPLVRDATPASQTVNLAISGMT